MSFEIHDQKLYHYFPESEEEHKIVIPEGVISIEEKAFESAKNLKEVFLPDSLVCIHKKAFIDCENLKELYLPDKLERIGEYAFMSCDSLELISPASLRGLLEDNANNLRKSNRIFRRSNFPLMRTKRTLKRTIRFDRNGLTHTK